LGRCASTSSPDKKKKTHMLKNLYKGSVKRTVCPQMFEIVIEVRYSILWLWTLLLCFDVLSAPIFRGTTIRRCLTFWHRNLTFKF
jgi:hypothetical protein